MRNRRGKEKRGGWRGRGRRTRRRKEKGYFFYEVWLVRERRSMWSRMEKIKGRRRVGEGEDQEEEKIEEEKEG